MKIYRKIIKIDEALCDGCGLCARACSEGAIQLIDGKARLIEEKYCDGLGACLGECPRGAIMITEREAEEFDAEAVEEFLKKQEGEGGEMVCGCPSSYIKEFKFPAPAKDEPEASQKAPDPSYLTHWPVQIRLIPPTAPFLKKARLLIAADCTCVAAPNFHRDFLQGRVLMIGCPKFDDPGPLIQKIAQIVKANEIKGITALIMEVPCCKGLVTIILKGLEMAGKEMNIEKIVIDTQGKVLYRKG